MLSVEKFTAEGEFDKVKTQMVANGNEQDPSLHPDNSSLYSCSSFNFIMSYHDGIQQ
jgi:hypothetical protein